MNSALCFRWLRVALQAGTTSIAALKMSGLMNSIISAMAQTVAGLLAVSIFLDEGLVDVVWVLVDHPPAVT